MAAERIGGTLLIKVNGQAYRVVGDFTYNLGAPKRESVIGADGVHGYKEMPQAPSLKGEFRDSVNLDLATLLNLKDATIVLELANGKVISFRDAFYSGDGESHTEEGNIQAEFSALSAEEIR